MKVTKNFSELKLEFGNKLMRFALRASTAKARRKLRSSGPLRILLDNSVRGHAVTHETMWISTGTATWGNQTVDNGYAARVPVYSLDTDTKLLKEVKYLPAIAMLAEEGLIQFFTSVELEVERMRQPAGRFGGYYSYDLDLFSRLNYEFIDTGSFMTLENLESQAQRLSTVTVNPFQTLVRKFGQSNSLDAWHVHTAHIYKLDCFLAIDFPLHNIFQQQKGSRGFPKLDTEVLLPSDLGRKLGIIPIHPNHFSYQDSSFPVEPGLSTPQNRRQSPKK